MSAAKLEKLVELVINEDTAKAEQLFHEFVVEKSREIYENIINEDMSQGLLDEIEMEEEGMEGMVEADEEEFETDEIIDGDYDTEGDDMEDEMSDMDDDMEDDMMDMDDEEGDMAEEEIEDRVVDLEEKMDELIARFEAEMGEEEEGEEEEAEGEAEEAEGEEEEAEGEEEEEESGLMEEVQLKKVSMKHGDNGVQTKSPVAKDAHRMSNGANPVKFAGESETVPTSPKGPSNAYSKGEKQVPGAGQFKNVAGKTSLKGESAPAPVKKDASHSKSPVAESRKAKRSK